VELGRKRNVFSGGVKVGARTKLKKTLTILTTEKLRRIIMMWNVLSAKMEVVRVHGSFCCLLSSFIDSIFLTII
jgi:hypothetical protein